MLALLLVTKDEGELLRLNLEHHLAAGFDRIAVADNESTDATADIAREFGDAVSYRRFSDFHVRQSVRRSMLMELQESGAAIDWAVIADTDEFFWAEEPIGDRLARTSEDAVVVNFGAKLYLPTALDPTEGSVANRRRYRTSGGDSPLHSSYVVGKSAYRPDWLIARGHGHFCARHEHLCQDATPDQIEAGEDRVHHFMIQDEDQFVEKVVRLIEWAKPPKGIIRSTRWRLTPKQERPLPGWSDPFKKEWWGVYQSDGVEGVRKYYRTKYVLSADAVRDNIDAGYLVHDDAMARWREMQGLR